MAKVLILGSNGLLGQNLIHIFMAKHQVVTASLEEQSFVPQFNLLYHSLDLSDRRKTRELIVKINPDIIINTAAYTNVDGCENDEPACWAANVKAVEHIVKGAEDSKAILVQISTDYIFSGKNAPYHEDSDPSPLGVYGRSKLAAENLIKASGLQYQIIRTQILYGTGEKIRPNFVTWVIDSLRQGKKIKVVKDQIGSPTHVSDLATAILKLLEVEAYGCFHVSSETSISRYDFACLIGQVFDLDTKLIEPSDTASLNQKAPRPENSTFRIDKLVNATRWHPHNLEDALSFLKEEMNL